uniref:Uncharacterized protein n=1 Tax=Arundo donax TaxID=35708 RepID=A0A0A8YEI6_ARUDO
MANSSDQMLMHRPALARHMKAVFLKPTINKSVCCVLVKTMMWFSTVHITQQQYQVYRVVVS